MSDQNSEKSIADREREGEALSEMISQFLGGRRYLILYEDMCGGVSECSLGTNDQQREALGQFLLTDPNASAVARHERAVTIPKRH